MNEEEKEVFKRELDHFLTEVVPFEWNNISNDLKQVFEILRGKFSILNLYSQPNHSGDLISPSPILEPLFKIEKRDEKTEKKEEKKQNFEYITFGIGQFVKNLLNLDIQKDFFIYKVIIL